MPSAHIRFPLTEALNAQMAGYDSRRPSTEVRRSKVSSNATSAASSHMHLPTIHFPLTEALNEHFSHSGIHSSASSRRPSVQVEKFGSLSAPVQPQPQVVPVTQQPKEKSKSSKDMSYKQFWNQLESINWCSNH